MMDHIHVRATVSTKEPNKWINGCCHQYKLYSLDNGQLIEEFTTAKKNYKIPPDSYLIFITEVDSDLEDTEFYKNNAGRHVVVGKAADVIKLGKFF